MLAGSQNRCRGTASQKTQTELGCSLNMSACSLPLDPTQNSSISASLQFSLSHPSSPASPILETEPLTLQPMISILGQPLPEILYFQDGATS